MKNVLIGIAAGIAIGYVLRKMEDDGKFKCIHDDMSELADRAKKKIKDVVDKGVNEYMRQFPYFCSFLTYP